MVNVDGGHRSRNLIKRWTINDPDEDVCSARMCAPAYLVQPSNSSEGISSGPDIPSLSLSRRWGNTKTRSFSYRPAAH
jgi:hypothetical protein